MIVRPICRFLDSVFSLGRTCKEANRPKYGFSARTKFKVINQPSDEMVNDSPLINSGISTTTTALLSLALVFLDRCFVVTQALEISEDSSLGDLTLEATQRRFDAFVFADRDLSHSTSKRFPAH